MISADLSLPAGYTGSVVYDDAGRSWRVFAKPNGSTWATECGSVLHAHATPAEVVAAAEVLATRWIDWGMVR